MQKQPLLSSEDIAFLLQTESLEDIEEYLHSEDPDTSPAGLKRQSRGKFRNAVLSGKMRQWPCNVCGNEKSEAHHPDYSKPLDIIWLCHRHHVELHTKLRREQKS